MSKPENIQAQHESNTSRLARAACLAFAAAMLATAALVPIAQAGKAIDRVIAGSSSSGASAGQFANPEGIAFNDPGIDDNTTDPLGGDTDGYFYVVDQGNQRVQAFDAAGNFKFMFGRNVVKAGGAGDIAASGNEHQAVTVVGTGGTFTLRAPNNFDPGGPQINEHQTVTAIGTGGAFTLHFEGQDTAAIARSATAEEVEAALEALATVGSGNVSVSGPAGGPWDVEFVGDLAATNVLLLNGDEEGLTGEGKSLNVSDGQTTGPIARTASAAEVDAALEELGAIGVGGAAVTGPAGGPWDIEFTGALSDADVKALIGDASSLTGSPRSVSVAVAAVAATVFEVCSVAADCRGGAEGEGAGEFKFAKGIAINQQTGDIYVHDVHTASRSNNRIQQFAADGSFIRAWGWDVAPPGQPGDVAGGGFEICTSVCQRGTAGGDGGQFNASNNEGGKGIAIDPAAPHHLFVGDAGNKRIQEFTASGEFVRLWGWDVVSPGQPGDVGNGPSVPSFEICSTVAPGACKTGVTGIGNNGSLPNGSFSSGPTTLAVDGDSGIVYTNGLDNGIYRFDSDESTPGNLLLTSVPFINRVQALTFAPDGDLLAVTGSPTTRIITELDTSVAPPVTIDQHLGSGVRFEQLAVDPVSGDFYLTGPHQVLAADDDGAPPATATIDQPLAVGSEVTFSGTVTPGGPAGIDATYNFQYSKDGVNWITVPGSANPLGDGNSPIAVEDTVTGLEPSQYFVRIATRKAFGNPEVYFPTPPLEFSTGALPASAETVAPQHRGATSATLTGLVNPNNLPTTYYFQWGETESYGNQVPLPAGSAGEGFGEGTVTARIEGLNPQTTYHYRVVADNGLEVSPGQTEAVGADVSFTTRAEVPAEGARGWEMVTPPFKATRSIAGALQEPRNNPSIGIPSHDGEAIAWSNAFLPLTDDVAMPAQADNRVFRRTATGWTSSTLNSAPLLLDPDNSETGNPMFKQQAAKASSGDLRTMVWTTGAGTASSGGFLPTEGSIPNPLYVRRDGVGTAGFSPWLTNPEAQIFGGEQEDLLQGGGDRALVNDDGTAMVRWGRYRGVAEDPTTPGDDDPSNEQQLSDAYDRTKPVPGGATIYLQTAADPDDLPLAAKDLVNECTGVGADATELLTRLGSGLATDLIGTRTCTTGNVTSVRGAAVGGSANSALGSTQATAMSNDGRRVFFESPDRSAAGVPEACASATGPATNCPPQLFVRQYDENGENPIVRWISRSRSTAAGDGAWGGGMIPGQQVGLLGRGAIFQAASRDGRVVYFKTDAPLVPDDPNGGSSVTTGIASGNSWDLYRYELPASLSADPDDGILTRISGGPTGNADPSSNTASGTGSPLRFHSDSGERAYFVTGAPIAGADASPPAGAVTAPGGAVANDSSRNLYLFDDTGTGADRYRFIARIPFFGFRASGPESANGCSSWGPEHGQQLIGQFAASRNFMSDKNCFRGTPDGRVVVFATLGQLTADDTDDVADLYLYDAAADELVRITAPPLGSAPYPCVVTSEGVSSGSCHGDFGFEGQWGPGGIHAAGERDAARGWGGIRYDNVTVDENGVVSVLFESQTQLVPEDTNGDYWDVYRWRNGELSLVTSGNTQNDAWFSGSSLDGEDIFVFTSERIDPRELDDSDFDLYDARIGGGFPYTPPPVPCQVLTLSCEVNAIPAPPSRSAASTAPAAAGNVKPKAKKKPKCRKGKVRKKGHCVKRKSSKQHSKRAANKTGRAGK